MASLLLTGVIAGFSTLNAWGQRVLVRQSDCQVRAIAQTNLLGTADRNELLRAGVVSFGLRDEVPVVDQHRTHPNPTLLRAYDWVTVECEHKCC